MRVPQMVSDFFEWRWAPCVGLTAASLAFVALALLLIPSHIGGEPRAAAALNSFSSPRALYGSSLAQTLSEPAEPLDDVRPARSLPPPASRGNARGPAPQRGFSPIIDRPEPPQPPQPTAATAATAEPSQPVPSSTVVIQPIPGGESREVTVQ
jgi:hypothetical protein